MLAAAKLKHECWGGKQKICLEGPIESIIMYILLDGCFVVDSSSRSPVPSDCP